VMNKYLAAAIIPAIAGMSGAAYAADLPSRMAPSSPPPVFTQAPIYSWTGFYAGINGGGGFGNLGRGAAAFGKANGALIGGTVGYNYQINQFVVGLEGDMGWSGFNASNTLPGPIFMRATMNSFATLRGRAGMTFDRTLVYATAGYAGGNVRSTVVDTTIPAGFSNNGWRNGWVVGAGLEYALTPKISLKGEYLYTQIGNDNNSVISTSNAGYRGSIIRTGVNYRF
jgi:outer membrane immunogenic protein